jgi:hypothetical protein
VPAQNRRTSALQAFLMAASLSICDWQGSESFSKFDLMQATIRSPPG